MGADVDVDVDVDDDDEEGFYSLEYHYESFFYKYS